MTRLDLLMSMSAQFCPDAVLLAFNRLYAGQRFFDKKSLKSEFTAGSVRMALHLVLELRPEEPLTEAERKLSDNLDPRAVVK